MPSLRSTLALLGAGASAAAASAGTWPTQMTSTSLGNMSLPIPSLVTWGTGVVGGLFKPSASAAEAKSRIGVLVMHAEQDYTTFYPCSELPAHGFTTLCLNNALSKTGQMNDLDFETMMSDVNGGVAFLKERDDIDKVVIWGHSGGGAMMAAYQNVAENGAAACNGTEKLYPCSSAMDGLTPADGVLLIDANYGLSTMAMLSLDPSVTNASIDLYDPANGWTENGANYTASFVKEFYAGVAKRWNGLIEHALARNEAIQAGNGTYTDDEGLVIEDANYIGFNNKIITQDIHYLSHTTHKWPLLHKGGLNKTTTQIVPSVRVASGGIPSDMNNFYDGALKTTITRFLSTFAVRIDPDTLGVSADNLTGVDFSSSQTATVGSIPGISVPLLTMGNTGHYEYLNAEKIYLASQSKDKSIAFVEGAQHTIETCTECERYPGEFGDTVRTAFDFMDAWLGEGGRFMK